MSDEQLLAPVPPDGWGDAEYAAFGKLLGLSGADVPRAGSGERFDPLNFPIAGLLVRHPSLAGAFLHWSAWLLKEGLLPDRLREFVILRVIMARRSAYLWGEHVEIARRMGLTDDEIDGAARGEAEAFSVDERIVLQAAEQLLEQGKVDSATWRSLVNRLDAQHAMEVVFVVGTYSTLATAVASCGLPPQHGACPLPAVGWPR